MTSALPDAPSAQRSGGRIGDAIATVLLMLLSIVVAVALFIGALPWAMDSGPNVLGFVLGLYGPIVITALGLMFAIVRLVRRRLAFWIPLAATALSVLVWWIGSLIVAS